jgi:hypothetical protein
VDGRLGMPTGLGTSTATDGNPGTGYGGQGGRGDEMAATARRREVPARLWCARRRALLLVRALALLWRARRRPLLGSQFCQRVYRGILSQIQYEQE